MSDRIVEHQIARILDENSAKTLSVIIQAISPELEAAVREAARAAARTRAVTRARTLLPTELSAQKKSVVSADLPLGNVETLRARGAAAFRPIGESPFLKNIASARRNGPRGMPRPKSLSGSTVLEIDRDDLARLPKEIPEAVAVYPNRRISVPPRIRSTSVPVQIERRTSHAWGLEATGALACWGAFGARGQGVRVAVLDTGVEASHPDLKGKIEDFVEFDLKGKVVRSGVKQARDGDGHGTHVAGTIVGGNGSGRWIGMAPEAKLLVAKVLGTSSGTDEQILAGLDWAVAQRADVINMSLGAESFHPDVLDTYSAAFVAARSAGIPVVVAIGNDGAQVTGSPGNDLFALAVGATDFADCIAAFSGGRTQRISKSKAIDPKQLPFVYSKPDLCAPGVDVLSCSGAKSWDYASGTSMACPHVTGAIALLLSRVDKRKPFQNVSGYTLTEVINDLLVGSVHELGENGQDHRYGWGRLNVLAAYDSAVNLGYIA